jgi:hypothetical protein
MSPNLILKGVKIGMPRMNAEKYLAREPVREVGLGSKTTGRRIPSRTYMSNTLVPGSNTYIEMAIILGCGGFDKAAPGRTM